MKTQCRDYMHEPLVRSLGRLPADPPQVLTVLTWNVERGTKFEAIAEALAGPLRADLYALQEVDRYTRRSGDQDLPEKIARKLGVDYAFGTEFEELAQRGGFDLPLHGQVILSRLPIRRARILRFQYQPHNWGGWWKPRLACLQPRRGGRMALVAEIEWDGATVVFYDAHLESQASDHDRARQMGEVLHDLWPRYAPGTPIIIAGDFNTKEEHESAAVRLLRAAAFDDVLERAGGDLHTSPKSRRRLDWIFVRDLAAHGALIHPLSISDHYPITAKITPAHHAESVTDGAWAGQGRSEGGRNES